MILRPAQYPHQHTTEYKYFVIVISYIKACMSRSVIRETHYNTLKDECL